MKKTSKTALTAAVFAAAMGMTACSKALPVKETEVKTEIYYYGASENGFVKASFVPGDIDGDGKQGLADVIMLHKYLKNQQTLTKEQFSRADVNKDEKVNIFDFVSEKKDVLLQSVIPQPVYGPPEWFETEATSETYEPETDEPVCVYGPPEWFETTEPTETEYDPSQGGEVCVYGPPEWFETAETTEPTETEYDPESEEQYDVYGPPAWFDDTTEPPTDPVPQPVYGPPEIFDLE